MHWYDPNGFTLTLMAVACWFIVHQTRQEWRMRREIRRQKRVQQIQRTVWNAEVEE